jgi:hypothetical protein
MIVIVFLVRNSLVKKEVETVRCYEATAISSFVTKVWGEVLIDFSCSCCTSSQ